jgi:predicted nucleic acid-binding protein
MLKKRMHVVINNILKDHKEILKLELSFTVLISAISFCKILYSSLKSSNLLIRLLSILWSRVYLQTSPKLLFEMSAQF